MNYFTSISFSNQADLIIFRLYTNNFYGIINLDNQVIKTVQYSQYIFFKTNIVIIVSFEVSQILIKIHNILYLDT